MKPDDPAYLAGYLAYIHSEEERRSRPPQPPKSGGTATVLVILLVLCLGLQLCNWISSAIYR